MFRSNISPRPAVEAKSELIELRRVSPHRCLYRISRVCCHARSGSLLRIEVSLFCSMPWSTSWSPRVLVLRGTKFARQEYGRSVGPAKSASAEEVSSNFGPPSAFAQSNPGDAPAKQAIRWPAPQSARWWAYRTWAFRGCVAAAPIRGG